MNRNRYRKCGPPSALKRAAHEVSGHCQTTIAQIISAAALCLLSFFPTNAKAQTTNQQPEQQAAATPPSPLSQESIRASADVQRRVRDSARELVGTILDSQLEQLKQNGLQHTDIYRDIESMRGDIDSLIDSDMRGVVELLGRAEQADAKNRGPIYSDARSKIREILSRLLADRRDLERRLRIAELAAQTRYLIEKQTSVRTATESLSGAPQQQQSDATLATVQDQRDIKTLFDQLVASLRDVSLWSGDIGAAASDGLRIVQSANASNSADAAASSLELGKFGDASKSQQAVVAALKSLLVRLESLQGSSRSQAEESLKLIRELEKRQGDLLAQTKQSDFQATAVDPLVDRQSGINKDIAKLSPSLESLPAAQAALEQAETASDNARSKLFEAKQTEAVDEQSTVLAALEAIERQIERADNSQAADKSAADLARQLEALKNAQQHVAEAQNHERRASAAIEQSPQAAREDSRAADELKKASDAKPLPAAVRSRLNDAKDAAGQGAELAQSNAGPAAKTAAQQAAGDSLDRAAAEVAAAINDTKLDEKTVAAGELARAAEALERATAAEKEIASKAGEAAKRNGITAEQAARMIASQVDVKRVAERIAAGVRQLAPEASARLDSAGSQINAAGRDLMAVNQQPGESSKPALANAAKSAEAAAHVLTDAAAELRKAVAKEAGVLEQTADEQSKPIAGRRNEVQAIEQANQTTDRASKLSELAKSTAPIDPDAGSALREAAKAAAELNSQNGQQAQRVSNAVQQADASLAAREQRLEDAKQLARQIIADAQSQQHARDAIQADAAKLAAAQTQAAAAELEAAEESFAQAQNQIGEDTERLSGQTQIANQPVREGLEAASHLNPQRLAAEEQAQDTGQRGGGNQAEAMGTGMVPNSPMATARRIAGPEASAASALAGQSAGDSRSRNGQSLSSQQSNGRPDGNQHPNGRASQLGAAAPASSGGAGIKSGQKTNNVVQINEELQSPPVAHPYGNHLGPANSLGRDANASPPSVSQDPPWFADLPPEARNAIRAKAHQAAPKVYEDRLKDYFENSDGIR